MCTIPVVVDGDSELIIRTVLHDPEDVGEGTLRPLLYIENSPISVNKHECIFF